MAELIAGLYEKNGEIGSGGGGVVYLGRHIRLDKVVVLKADKRVLKSDERTLRREVDLLKELSQTYIPQVYDFVREDDAVYTVMDYIEGESLDKLIKRGERPPQGKVLKWACQLLEALDYLHTRPPHGILHGDIKPANIMLRPNGDICLIDYNIALALGEDGAVKVGFSRGYASPEHYGYTYVSERRDKGHKKLREKDEDKTLLLTDDDKTVILKSPVSRSSFSGGSGSIGSGSQPSGGVLLDVRSDIYSLGATLYHLISGIKPAENAEDVVQLTSEHCSPSVARIINQAMSPAPDDRFQSAAEMLEEFRNLYKTDIRVVKRKRRMIATASVIAVVFLTGCGLTYIGLRQSDQYNNALALSEYSANALNEGNISKALEYALEAIPKGTIFDAPLTANAQKALTDALGVYELSDNYQDAGVVTLSSEPFHISYSEDGRYIVTDYAYNIAVYDGKTLEKLVELPIQESALSDFVFGAENRLLYAGEDGVTVCDISGKNQVWKGDIATTLAISGDKSVVAAVNRGESIYAVYDVVSGEKLHTGTFGERHLPVAVNDTFADPEDEIFELNEDGSLLAVTFDNGGFYIKSLENPDEDIVIFEDSEYNHFEGGFIGNYFAYIASKPGSSDFGIIDTNSLGLIAEYHSDNELLLKCSNGSLFLADGGSLVEMSLPDFSQKERAYVADGTVTNFATKGDEVVVAVDKNRFVIFDEAGNILKQMTTDWDIDFLDVNENEILLASRNTPDVRMLTKHDYSQKTCFKYDPAYTHDEARVSADEKTVMLFSINGFAIFDEAGKEVAQMELPEPESIYDQQFIRADDSSYLEVIWYDGSVRKYSSSDGRVISQEKIESPKKNLYEEFYTEKYRVASTLHEAPVVYDLASGKELASLQEDAHLTYVTDTNEGLLTEYISSEGSRYGVLLNDSFEPVAFMPGVCDVYGDKVMFDYNNGNIRQSRLYSIQELVALGEKLTKQEDR